MTEIKHVCAPTYTEVGYATFFTEFGCLVESLQTEIDFELFKYLYCQYNEIFECAEVIFLAKFATAAFFKFLKYTLIVFSGRK